MKRNLGYDMRTAEKTFFDTADGTNLLVLVEVFARTCCDRHTDVTRTVGDVEDAGELWMADEDGINEMTEAGWEYEGREAVGFDRAELADLASEAQS